MAGLIVLRGLMTGSDVYGAFLRGAESGMRSAVSLLPPLMGMLMMLALINASGLAAMLTRAIGPVLGTLGIPGEIAPLLMLRPLTGSGSLASLEQILAGCGPDSRAGRMASVLMGSSETIFYTMTVYLGAAGIRKLPYALPVSLAAYLVGVVVCTLVV